MNRNGDYQSPKNLFSFLVRYYLDIYLSLSPYIYIYMVDKLTYQGSSVSSTEIWHQHATSEGMDSYR